MWHVTRDTQGVVNVVSKFQFPGSNGLGVDVLKIWRKSIVDWLTDLMSDGGVCITAPATQSLLIYGPKQYHMQCNKNYDFLFFLNPNKVSGGVI